jgi:hypothetical protein
MEMVEEGVERAFVGGMRSYDRRNCDGQEEEQIHEEEDVILYEDNRRL